MDVKYKVATAVVDTFVSQVVIDGQPAEVHQKKLILEMLPVDASNYGTIKLVVDPSNAATFVQDANVTVTFTVE